MRTTEIALKAVAKCLSIPEPANPSWGIWLSVIRQERLSRGARWAENDLFQGIWQTLDAVKDSLRDPTMHVEKTYTEEEAKKIYSDAKALMQKVAKRMDENGNPKA